MVSIIKNIIVILGLIALAGIGYYLFVVEREATVTSSDFDAGGGISVTSESFLQRLSELQTIQLSSEIFSDARFRSLEDFSSAIDRVPFGRELPFTETDFVSTLFDLGDSFDTGE